MAGHRKWTGHTFEAEGFARRYRVGYISGQTQTDGMDMAPAATTLERLVIYGEFDGVGGISEPEAE